MNTINKKIKFKNVYLITIFMIYVYIICSVIGIYYV
jgi:hypothetical protein